MVECILSVHILHFANVASLYVANDKNMVKLYHLLANINLNLRARGSCCVGFLWKSCGQ